MIISYEVELGGILLEPFVSHPPAHLFTVLFYSSCLIQKSPFGMGNVDWCFVDVMFNSLSFFLGKAADFPAVHS